MALVKFNEGSNRNVLNPFSDLFESYFNDSFISDRMVSRVPAVNISETEENYEIEVGAPGLKKEDFKINLDKNMLNNSVEKPFESTEQNKTYSKREYNYSSFVRSFALPESADNANIAAEYMDGVLKISVPKKEEAKMQPREISIK